MGGGSWTESSFASYSHSVGRTYDAKNRDIIGSYSAQEMFKSHHLDEALNPFNVIRECCDSEEHPNTVPVILALDVTGSMGSSSVEVAKKLNVVMTELYNKVKDVEFMIMAIGDLAYDTSPIQVSQFESDIRIAEQLDKVYFEAGGGGNTFESYTAAWYFGARHTKLDCWNRGKKGLIITIGDELINPYLPKKELSNILGDNLQDVINTKDLLNEVSEKYELYHLNVLDTYSGKNPRNIESFTEYIGENHVRNINVNNIAESIIDIIINHANNQQMININNKPISW